jgi:hypothetical protein
MRKLTPAQIAQLKQQHQSALQSGNTSATIRKGYEIPDYSEPAGRRFLTDKELQEITQ